MTAATRSTLPDAPAEPLDAPVHRVTALAERVRLEPGRFAGVRDMVSWAAMNAVALRSLFLAAYHVTPRAFLDGARVDAARGILSAGTREVPSDGRPERGPQVEALRARGAAADVVAALVGYASPAGFADRFRRRTGLTPLEYARLGDAATFRIRLPRTTRRGGPCECWRASPRTRRKASPARPRSRRCRCPAGRRCCTSNSPPVT